MSSIAYRPSTSKPSSQVFQLPSLTAHRCRALAIITVGLICLAASLRLIPSAASRVLFPSPHETPLSIHIPNQNSSYCPWCTDPILCARKFLFVIATGRSGSTTVMGMLNAVPGVFLSGENNAEASRLRAVYEERVARRRGVVGVAANNETQNVETDQHELLSIQRWIWEANLPPTFVDANPTIVGFKEIRWTPEDVAFIQQVCPCSRFVANARKDAQKQAESSFFSISDTPLQDVELANQRQELTKKAITPPERTFLLDLEDFSVDKFNDLVHWLGGSCRFRKLIHSNADSSLDLGDRARCV